MDGYRGRDYYTPEELREAGSINFWIGSIAGMLATLGLEFGAAWYFNWI